MEETNEEELDSESKIRIATELIRSQTFDNFLANKFTGVKRYGGEGAESMMAFFSEFFKLAASGTNLLRIWFFNNLIFMCILRYDRTNSNVYATQRKTESTDGHVKFSTRKNVRQVKRRARFSYDLSRDRRCT